ncbi:MAG: adenosine kinase, partial [Sulfitobacter sp.]|nr:adenosine kinase [Sulfitobacter sp.]
MKTYDLVGIGNAVVDVISHSDDAFLDNMGIEKGIMQLVPQDRAEQLYAAMDDRVQTPGGAVANTVAGVGALGLNTAFIGRVRDDGLGRFYAKAMTDNGIDFVNVPVTDGDTPTSRSMIFVTPDGERSMNTYLGISTGLSSADVPAPVAGNAKIMFLEGYLFDEDAGKTAFREAARAAKAGGGKAGITISDPFCVERHRADFLQMIEHELDFVIGNEAEIESLFQTDDLEDAMARTAAMCPVMVCTRGGDGVTLIAGSERVD